MSENGGNGERRRWPFKRRQMPENHSGDSGKREIIEKVVGVPTDPKLVQFFFRQQGRDVHPIATDSFLDKSRSEYNPAWLTRELVQNFVDHNPENPGTLDGVRFTDEDLPNGGKRFRIEGAWPFEDPTGVMTPHSEKPVDMNTAGGNGIGLKQTAIRLLRDFGVGKFAIEGEGWSVDYHMVTAAAINEEWRSMEGQEPLHTVKHDWLLADIKETTHYGKNAYIIETDNPEVIDALSQLPRLGVSKENPYLQEVDYENRHGAIKWLPDADDEGRLFMNGQVMNYKTKGDTASDYWKGPEGVTIRLNNVQYAMNIDRPPIESSDLSKYLSELTYAMTEEEILTQLQRSEHLWAGHVDSDYFRRQGMDVVLGALSSRLKYSGYDRGNYNEYFPDRKYVYADRQVQPSDLGKLREQGYTICPDYLEALGMPSASSKLDDTERASREVPRGSDYRYEMARLAENAGIEVGYASFDDISDSTDFAEAIATRLGDQLAEVEVMEGKEQTLRLKLRGPIPESLLSRPMFSPRGEEQQLLFTLRGIAAFGMEHSFFTKVFTSQGEYLTTFGLEKDYETGETMLFARNVKNSNEEGSFIEITLDEEFFAPFVSALTEQQGDSEPTIADKQKPAAPVAGRKFKEIPVEQPEGPNLTTGGKVRVVERKLTESEQSRLAQMEENLHGISTAVSQLESLIPEEQLGRDDDQSIDAIAQYLEWRDSEQFYGRLGEESGYLTGRHLVDLINEQNEAAIDAIHAERTQGDSQEKIKTLQERLVSIVKQMNPGEDAVDEFSIVFDPSERQLSQLSLLRLYAQATLGVEVVNDLFLYQGTGSKGINLGQKAIGLHEALLDVSFLEALRTFGHEISHNAPDALDHGNSFRHAMESVFTTMIEKTTNIAVKASSGQPLTDDERMILDIQKTWQKLQKEA